MSAEVVFGLLIPVVLLVLVALAGVLQWAENRSPRLKAFLDRHVGEDPVWDR